jgi:hypothetical protein
MPKVNVKGYGNVNFPNGMDVNDIRDTLRRRYSDQTNSDLLQSASKYGAPTGSVAAPYKPSLMERAGQGVADVLSDTGLISNRYGAQQIGKNVSAIGEMLPGIGDVAAVDDFVRAKVKGDNLGMGLAALGVLPLAGDLAGKAGKTARKADDMLGDMLGDFDFKLPEKQNTRFNQKPKYQPDLSKPQVYNPKGFTDTKTGMPTYDDMLTDPGYFKSEKGLVASINKNTSPDDYLNEAAKGFDSTVGKLVGTRDDDLINEYADKMLRGEEFPMGVVDYSKGFSQEGIHRALAAKKAGINKMPYMVVNKTSNIKPIMSDASKFIPENIKDFTVKKGYQPSETVKAYKLFKTKPGDDNIYPLFVNSNDRVDVGKWVDAEIGEIAEKGSKRKSSAKPSDKPMVKSSLGNLAFRPGWHAGDAASAQHIGGKAVKGSKKPQYRPANQVWAEVEMPNDVNWQDEATKRADIKKDGNVNARTAHITDQLPLGGSYRYKTNSNMQGSWIISGNMKVNNKLNNEQVKGVGLSTGIPDLPILPDYLEANKGLKESDLTEVAIKELRSSYPDYYKSRFNK